MTSIVTLKHKQITLQSMYVLLDNIRSAHNVGAIARTADAMGISAIYTLGVTPHCKQSSDSRLPHVISRAEKQIAKTALGAERLLGAHFASFNEFQKEHSSKTLVSIEQTEHSLPIQDAPQLGKDTIIVVGNEIDGVSSDILAASQYVFEIPMRGQKESLNVSAATAIALYTLT